MKKRQLQAVKRIEKELKRAGELGLMGGVYDGAFCLWQVGKDPFEGASFLEGGDFFEEVVNLGGVILQTGRTSLDGGAGV